MDANMALALEDFVPVILSGIGLTLLTRMIWELERGLGQMAAIGTVITVIGGLLKASAKVVWAVTGDDILWMSQSLFPMLGIGFTLFGWSLYQVRRVFQNKPPLSMPWLVPAIVIAIFGGFSIYVGIAGGPWKLVMLALATLANLSFHIMLIGASWKRGMRLVGALFLIDMLIVLLMSGMAPSMEQTIAMQWFEQLMQSFSQGCFALASWQYGRNVLASYRQPIMAQPALG